MSSLYSVKDLDAVTRKMIRMALRARKRAYAPYSKFRVGSALLDEKGRIHTGCNVENVSYTMVLHAEQVALGKMVSRGGKEIKRLVVVTSSEAPAFPCGPCRQVISEFSREITIHAVNSRGTRYRELALSALLPQAFERGDLA